MKWDNTVLINYNAARIKCGTKSASDLKTDEDQQKVVGYRKK